MSEGDLETLARDAHAASLRRLSPRVQAQLQQRRRLALAGEPAPRKRPVLGLALASLAVCAIAIGVARLPDGGESPATTVSSPAPPTDVLDQSPDFYAWLASDDASALAME